MNAPWGKLQDRVWHLWRIQLPHLSDARTIKNVLYDKQYTRLAGIFMIFQIFDQTFIKYQYF